MIPIKLSLSGFLSYRENVEINFTTFELACIAGANGAGKSSLLDAITWALFGEARRRDDALINAQSDTAEVSFIFAYEGNFYRVQRIKAREKTTALEFQIMQREEGTDETAASIQLDGVWKPLTERTLRETQARIQETLRLDYETFVNAAFFLQGKADQFTQQRPSDRKRILSSILGLDVWEVYRQRAGERRRLIEEEIEHLDGRLHEIVTELEEEVIRRENLKRLEKDLDRLSRTRQDQEKLLVEIRKLAAGLEARRNLVQALRRQAEAAERSRAEIIQRLENRQLEQKTYASLLERATEIATGYSDWQEQVKELKRWDEVANQFREQEKRRESPRMEIQAARSRLEGELESLQLQAGDHQKKRQEMQELEVLREGLLIEGEVIEEQLKKRSSLEVELENQRKDQADAAVENRLLKVAMNELKERIDRLRETEDALCPLCGQPLSPEHRQEQLTVLEAQGKEMGDRHRANQALSQEVDEAVHSMQQEIQALRTIDAELRAHTARLAQVNSQLAMLESQQETWAEQGAPRLQEIEHLLAQDAFALEARAQLAVVDAELKAIGYDASAHDATRQAELNARRFEEDMRSLDRARAALEPLEREIGDLQAQAEAQTKEAQRQAEEYDQAAQALAEEEAQAPDVKAVEDQLFRSQEEENRLRLEVGAAQQKVLVLEDLKVRRKDLEAQREGLRRQMGQYRQLERAFSKDGVPALLIEQSLPEIENKANEILDRLSDGEMTVRFITQSAYKDKSRDDLRETLEIQISDGAGTRDYEMYSGGEAFRVNFAVRLALSEVLAQRAGARLQTLVIDEGFGSQDAHGRQRLVEAINLVRPDFAKIIVITHIDELKDAFPTRIEVEKTDQGSRVQVVGF